MPKRSGKELEFQKKAITLIKYCGGQVIRIPAQFVAGKPDMVVAAPNHRTFVLEFKYNTTVLSKIQLKTCNDLIRGGFAVYGVVILDYPKMPIRAALFDINEETYIRVGEFPDLMNIIWPSYQPRVDKYSFQPTVTK